MRANTLEDLLKKNDKIAVSNITGREASIVSSISQKYCNNIIGGWALGKAGHKIETQNGNIPVFATFEELLKLLPVRSHPNKILVYSPPEAVYGDVKGIVKFGSKVVETIFIVTEHVSIEVTAKIYRLCQDANIDVIGCNTLGIINVHDHTRIGAVGGSNPEESFKPGSITVISNSGNMVNTISSYLLSSGMGTSFGISTGKDRLILSPIKDLLMLAEKDPKTKLVVLYIEPGGKYEYDALQALKKNNYSIPIIVYVAGSIAEKHNISLGHAGTVVEGKFTSAKAKQMLFDEYFVIPPFKPYKRYKKSEDLKKALAKGIRVEALHHIPRAVSLIVNTLGLKKDLGSSKFLNLNPWFSNLGDLGKHIPSELAIPSGNIPEPYKSQIKIQMKNFLDGMIRQPMQNSSRSSSNDGTTPRIYGYSLIEIMKKRSFSAALILYWTGELPKNDFEEKLAEMTLIAALTNGPGTISAQGSKLSASAGNTPNTAMIATMASIGIVHGGNGAKAVKFLLECFEGIEIKNIYNYNIDIKKLSQKIADKFKKEKTAAKEAGIDYEKIPCLGHPVFRNDPINYDPREKVIFNYIKSQGKSSIFFDFYHNLAVSLKENGSTRQVMAVNVDAAIASVWLGICWSRIMEKQMTIKRAMDIPFIAFALGRAAGGAGEFLDHQDFGTPMDMRIPVKDCKTLTRPRELL